MCIRDRPYWYTGLPSVLTFTLWDREIMRSIQGGPKHLSCGGIFSDIALLQIFSWFWQWNNLENRLIFGNVYAYKNGALIYPVYKLNLRCKSRIPYMLANTMAICRHGRRKQIENATFPTDTIIHTYTFISYTDYTINVIARDLGTAPCEKQVRRC